jgi:hypothetical protein
VRSLGQTNSERKLCGRFFRCRAVFDHGRNDELMVPPLRVAVFFCEEMVGARRSAAEEFFGFQDPSDVLAEGYYLENNFKHEEAMIENVGAVDKMTDDPGLIYVRTSYVLVRTPYRRTNMLLIHDDEK